jgi:molybdopterin-guanine dinucleotide biosynthesis protein A
VVLAGGRSSRFGSDKLAAAYRGAPMLHHPVMRLVEVCGEVVVVLGSGSEPSLPPEARVRFARDREEGQGPLAGVAAGLRIVERERALVVAGDMPDLVPAVLRKLVRAGDESSADAVALADGGRFRPVPCVLTTSVALQQAQRLLAAGERRFRALLEVLDAEAIDEAAWTALDPERRTVREVDALPHHAERGRPPG